MVVSVKLEDFEKLNKERTQGKWNDIRGSLAFTNDDDFGGASIGNGPNADFIEACSEMVPMLINLAKEVDYCLGALEQLSIQPGTIHPGSALHRVLKKVRAELEQT